MPSIPLTPDEERLMLSAIGVQSVDDLFSSIPPKLRERADIRLRLGEADDGSGRGLSEHDLRKFFTGLALKNAHAPYVQHFLGGGIYDNIVPAIVNQLVLRGEFLTCYTPYQPEISQGTLKAIFEFQTMIARLTSMEVANASMYDGATATAEACLMAQRLSTDKHRQAVWMSAAIAPDYRAVVTTFFQCHSNVPKPLAWDASGAIDLKKLQEALKKETPCAVVVASPNYFGIVEPLDEIKALLPKDCLLVVTMADPSSLSIFTPPGELGADIVVGEAHQFGTPMLFGGPHIGFFATRRDYLRQLPGRLVGETVDNRGQTAYTLTLSTREQHIRREKATSNICTNQGLIALRTTIYLSFLGKTGLQKLGEINFSLFNYLEKELEGVGIPLKFKGGLNYREGVFEVPNLKLRCKKAIEKGIVPGIQLAPRFPKSGEEFSNSLLICVHPKHTKQDIDQCVEVLSHD